MRRFEATPILPLRPFVHSYWGHARHFTDDGGFTITPDHFVELIFFVDPPLAEDAVGRARLPACALIGLLREPVRLIINGTVRCASIRMHAWSAGLFVPAPRTRSRRRWFDMTGPFAEWLGPVQDALRQDDWTGIKAIFDDALRRRLSSAPYLAALAAVRAFAALPDKSGEKVTTPTIARRQGRSRRQVERQVRALTHVSPKQLSSLARFQFVRDMLWAKPGAELAALAFEAGYADQAHLTRHFRRYAGQTPSDFLRDCARLKTHLAAPDVAFLQDARNPASEDGGYENPTPHGQPRSR